MADSNETLLRAILATTGRQAFSVERLTDIVLTTANSAKQLKAYNMCDGTRTQADIVKALKLDKGSFSTTVSRWEAEGVVFRFVDGKLTRPLHIYPLPPNAKRRGTSNGK